MSESSQNSRPAMSARRRLVFLSGIMATVSFAAVGLTLYLLYRTAPAAVQDSFLRTAMAAAMLAVGLVILGSVLFLWMTEPLVHRLEESEKHFRAVFNQTFQFLWLLHPDGKVVEANQVALDAAGVVPMAVRDRPLWQSRWWEGLTAQQSELQQAVTEATAGNFVRRELEMRGFGDRRLALDFSLKPLTDGEGRVVQLLAEGRDITERLRAEEMRNRLAAILEATSDFVGTSDPEGRATYVNRAGRTMLNLADEEDISRTSIRDFIPEWAQKLILEEAIPAALQKGVWSGETAILRRDGQEVPVSQVVIAPPTAPGQAPYIATIVRDLSERKRWEAELAQRTAFLHALIENSPLAVVVLDAENHITMCNPAFEHVFQYREEEIVGADLDALVAPPETVKEAADITRRSTQGEVVHTSGHRHRRDGSLVEVEIYGVPLMVKGEKRGAFAIYQDITERRRHEAERERLVEELQEALANVKTLRGLLPICASCKKIRGDGGYWSQIETYVRAHSEAEFSHGICPECAKQLYPEQFSRMFPELAGEKPVKE